MEKSSVFKKCFYQHEFCKKTDDFSALFLLTFGGLSDKLKGIELCHIAAYRSFVDKKYKNAAICK